MFNKIKIIMLGVVFMSSALVQAASDVEKVGLTKINQLLEMGMKQAASNLKESDNFLPYAYMLGSQGEGHQLNTDDVAALTDEKKYRDEVGRLITVISLAEKEDRAVGYLLFSVSSAKISDTEESLGINVFIEHKELLPRQLFYPFTRDASGKLVVNNGPETTFQPLVFKE